MFKKPLYILLIAITLFGGLNYSYAAGSTTPTSSTSSGGSATGDLKSSQFMFDLGVVTHKDIKEQNWVKKGINYVFERAITIMAATVGGAAVLMMAVGGFMLLFAGVKNEWYEKGKSMIFKAAIGIVFVLGAYILVTTIQLLVKSIFTGS